MFDMGFTEMMLIGIVALIVIGPERLPGVARTAGKYLGRLKRFVSSVRADVEQELRADELREILAQQQKELNTLRHSMNEAGLEIEKEAEALQEAGEQLVSGDRKSSTTAADADTRSAKDAAPADPLPESVASADDTAAAEPAAEDKPDSKPAVNKTGS